MRVRLLCERRPEARKKGDVDWEMFVRVLQSKGDMTEGEAAEKVQCAFRAFAARKLMATIRLEKLRASENKAVSMQTQQPQQPPPLLSSPTTHPSITHRATAIDPSSTTPSLSTAAITASKDVFSLAVNTYSKPQYYCRPSRLRVYLCLTQSDCDYTTILCGRLWLAAVSAGARKEEREERKERRWRQDAQGVTESGQEDKIARP